MFGKFRFPWRELLMFCALSLLAVPLQAQSGGQKYLLSVGINQYPGKPLKGCVNDANGMYELLTSSFGFNRGQSAVLTDRQATRAAILGGIQRYVNQTRSGDLFVFFYSGHGGLWPDHLSEERDEKAMLDLSYLRAQNIDLADGRYDSTLVPVDAAADGPRPWGNQILDDELYALFAQMTAKCVSVVLISDSCHSGTLSKGLQIDNETTEKFLDPLTLFGARLKTVAPPANAKNVPARNFHGQYLALTSSQDNQTSLDGLYENYRQGLFTYAIRKALTQSSGLSYRALLDLTVPIVRSVSKGTQVPNLDERFLDGRPSGSLFEALGGSCGGGGTTVQLRLQVRNRAGNLLPNSSFALFKPGMDVVPARIEPTDTLSILRTNSTGEAVGELRGFVDGDYLIKAVCVGYQSFVGKMRLVKRGQVLTVLIVLDPE